MKIKSSALLSRVHTLILRRFRFHHSVFWFIFWSSSSSPFAIHVQRSLLVCADAVRAVYFKLFPISLSSIFPPFSPFLPFLHLYFISSAFHFRSSFLFFLRSPVYTLCALITRRMVHASSRLGSIRENCFRSRCCYFELKNNFMAIHLASVKLRQTYHRPWMN